MISRVHLYSVCRSAEGEDLRVLRIRNRLPLREFTCTHVCWKGPRVHSRQPVQNEHTEGLGLPITIQWDSQQEAWGLGCPLFVVDSALVPIWWPGHRLVPWAKKRDNSRDIVFLELCHSVLFFFQNLLIPKCVWHQIKEKIRNIQDLINGIIFSETAKTFCKMTNLSQQLQRWLVISLDAFLLFVQVCRECPKKVLEV